MVPERWSARAACFAGALLFLLLLPPSAGADPGGDYADGLVARARQAQLSRSPQWRALLHYRKGILGDGSLIDDPEFFAAENGKEDPAAELEATIRAFFAPLPAEGRPAACRWVARLDWLVRELEIDRERLPMAECAPFEEAMAVVRPKAIIVAFPTAYMNSPASMYGHTLLVIDNVEDSELLSFAVNYAGRADTTFGPLYALKGIFGFYEGYYEILPYYAKLQEYNDVNDRDIWQYRLNLDAGEMRRLVMHVYELENIHSDYYFFDENCSYNLLWLLDVARPGLDLAGEKGLWVIPLDTVRRIERAGLVEAVEYRPSKSTKIRHIASQLDVDEQEMALEIAAGALDANAVLDADLPGRTKSLVCDLASEYLQYRYYDRELAQEEYAARFRAILAARSALGAAGAGTLTPARPMPPERGHRSQRLGAGGGALDEAGFAELRIRPVYHDLLDNPGGYLPGSEIVFGEVDLRYYPDAEDLQLEELTLVRIVSLAARDRFFSETSWMVDTGFARRVNSDGERSLVYDFAYGLGRAWSSRLAGLFYLMPELDAQLGGALDNWHSIGGGGEIGALRPLGSRWQARLFARGIYYALGEDGGVFEAGLGQNLEIARDWGLRADLSRVGEQDRWWWEWSLRLNLYHQGMP